MLTSDLFRDIRFAIRTLAGSPAFTVVAVATLGLGIGGATAVFSLLNALFLRPLPYEAPDQLVEISETVKDDEWMPVDYPDFLDWQRQSTAFSGMAITATFGGLLTGVGPADRVMIGYVSGNFFEILGTQLSLGRSFAADEDRQGAGGVTILSHPFWQARFGGDPSVIGRSVTLEQRTFTVIGILPPSFRYHRSADVYVPFAHAIEPYSMNLRGNHSSTWVLARLKDDATLDQARTQLATIAKRLEQQYPLNKGIGTAVRPMRELLVAGSRRQVAVLFGAVCLVLLIACANVANLLLARTANRRREIAIRTAVGASRGRVIRQLLSESIVLAAAGAGVALLFSQWALRLLSKFVPAGFAAEDVRIDGVVLLFACAVACATGLLAGLAPGLQAAGLSLDTALKEGSRGSSTAGQRKFRGALVVAEIGAAMVLLVSAGLLIESLWKLLRVNPGYRTERILTIHPSWQSPDAATVSRTPRLQRDLVERIEALPGVVSAGAVWPLPMTAGGAAIPIYRQDRPIPPIEQLPVPGYHAATPGFFRTMGIPLIKGRIFNEADGWMAPAKTYEELLANFQTRPLTGVVSESLARRVWPGEDPIGKRFRFGPPDFQGPWIEIVGVVGDVRHHGLDQPPEAEFYFSAHQDMRDLSLVIRTHADPATLIGAVRKTAQADSDLPLTDTYTVEELIEQSVSDRRTQMLLFGTFAGLALVLACVGIYGVISYSVGRRTQEIGIRVALGASGRDILTSVLQEGLVMAGVGVAIGTAGALAFTRVLASMLYNTTTTSPATYVAVSFLLTIVALAASYLPAHRAARLDPLTALRIG